MAPLVVGATAFLLTAVGYESAVSGGRGTVDGVAGMLTVDLPTYARLVAVTGANARVRVRRAPTLGPACAAPGSATPRALPVLRALPFWGRHASFGLLPIPLSDPHPSEPSHRRRTMPCTAPLLNTIRPIPPNPTPQASSPPSSRRPFSAASS
jgi:hypothetical protein